MTHFYPFLPHLSCCSSGTHPLHRPATRWRLPPQRRKRPRRSHAGRHWARPPEARRLSGRRRRRWPTLEDWTWICIPMICGISPVHPTYASIISIGFRLAFIAIYEAYRRQSSRGSTLVHKQSMEALQAERSADGRKLGCLSARTDAKNKHIQSITIQT